MKLLFSIRTYDIDAIRDADCMRELGWYLWNYID